MQNQSECALFASSTQSTESLVVRLCQTDLYGKDDSELARINEELLELIKYRILIISEVLTQDKIFNRLFNLTVWMHQSDLKTKAPFLPMTIEILINTLIYEAKISLNGKLATTKPDLALVYEQILKEINLSELDKDGGVVSVLLQVQKLVEAKVITHEHPGAIKNQLFNLARYLMLYADQGLVSNLLALRINNLSTWLCKQADFSKFEEVAIITTSLLVFQASDANELLPSEILKIFDKPLPLVKSLMSDLDLSGLDNPDNVGPLVQKIIHLFSLYNREPKSSGTPSVLVSQSFLNKSLANETAEKKCILVDHTHCFLLNSLLEKQTDPLKLRCVRLIRDSISADLMKTVPFNQILLLLEAVCNVEPSSSAAAGAKESSDSLQQFNHWLKKHDFNIERTHTCFIENLESLNEVNDILGAIRTQTPNLSTLTP